jgi:Arc/MetJ family transcription regulator
MEMKLEFVAAKQEQYKVKSEKNAVELATRQTIQEVNRQLKGDIEELDRHVQKNATRQKAENCRLH